MEGRTGDFIPRLAIRGDAKGRISMQLKGQVP